jgi:hypothetical protein
MPVDPRRLHRIWRRIELQDSVAGSAVDLVSELPWSNFSLQGLKDKTILHIYEDQYNAIKAVPLMPALTKEHMVMGKYIAHLIFSDAKGIFTDCVVHDPDYIRVGASAWPGAPPKIDLMPTPEMRALASSTDPRDAEWQEQMSDLIPFLKKGEDIPLPMENTIYCPRRTALYDNVGASIFTRIINFIAYEKAILNSSISAARRRAGKIRHITVGIDDVWEPQPETMDEISELFMKADSDPVGAIITTRTGVVPSEVGGNSLQDMVKISEEADFLAKGKMNAFGISEQFLTGESTYNSLEQLMSVFLEKIKALRAFHTENFLMEVARRIARYNEFVPRKQSELRHGYRIAGDKFDPYHPKFRYARSRYDSAVEQRLILPAFGFEKSLKPVADKDYLEILGKMKEEGIPITLRTWASAGGFQLEEEIEQFNEDIKVRKIIAAHNRRLKEEAPEAGGEGGGGGEGSGDLGGGDLGGGDLGGDLGGGGDSSGGDMGSIPDMLGGGDTGGESSPPAGGDSGGKTTAASVKSHESMKLANRLSEMAHMLNVFPLFPILGVDKEDMLQVCRKILAGMEGASAKSVGRKQLRELLGTGNAHRDEVVLYVLARSGILQNIKISKDTADDLGAAFASQGTSLLLKEAAFLSSMSYMNSSEESSPRESSSKARVYGQNNELRAQFKSMKIALPDRQPVKLYTGSTEQNIISVRDKT